MKRLASEVIKELEARIAHLENKRPTQTLLLGLPIHTMEKKNA